MPPSTDDLLYPGYYTDPVTGAWCTLPWPGDKTKDYGVPERLALLPDSLGPGVIAWCERFLVHPKTGEPWRFTPGQKRFLHLWYAVNDEGYFLYRSGVKRGAKGTGKDYLAAAMVCAEFCGPVHLAGWRKGTPIGEPQRMALVQIGANSLKQTNEVLGLANAMFSKELVKKLKIDTGITRTLKPGGSRIVGLTSSEKSAEGDPATFIALNEALALDTPVPTPSGWTTMGRLEEGSIIIGSGGKPVRVVQAFPVQEGRTCYRVTFSDGTSIVASDGHLWAASGVQTGDETTEILTTEQLVPRSGRVAVPCLSTLPGWDVVGRVEPVESVPVRCISVDAPDHLFVAGDGWKLTHNTHHFTEASGGHKLAAVARRNVGKSPAWIQGRLCEFTNAHQMGVDSVAEQSFEAWQAQAMGRTRLKDILYDSIEAPPGLDMYSLDDIATGLAAAYMDAPWADFNRLTGEIQDTRTTPADTIRFYFNGLAAEEDAWCDPGAFDDCAHPEIVVEKGEKIALFLDCSKNEDCTVLVGCRLSDGHVMALGCWQRPHGKKPEDWAVPREDVDAHVQDAMKTYKVCWFGVDPSPAKDEETGHLYWMPLIDSWHQQYARKLPVWATRGKGGHSVLFDMRQSQPGGRDRMRIFTEQAMQTVEEIEEERSLTHDGNPLLRQHVFNAKRRPNQWGIGLGKLNRDSEKKVDYAVAMVGARMGRILALRSGKVTPRRAGGAKRIKL